MVGVALLACAACGDDARAGDAGLADGTVADGDSVDSAIDGDAAAMVPAGDRIALFGPEPSFFEVWAANDATAGAVADAVWAVIEDHIVPAL